MADQEMFRRVVEMIDLHPELHSQAMWEQPPGHGFNPTCGTRRCLAGWAVWLKSLDLGLVSRKRDAATALQSIERLVADLDLQIDPDLEADGDVAAVGAAILDIDYSTANDLFWDLNNDRALARARSFATTGHDLTFAEIDAYNEDGED